MATRIHQTTHAERAVAAQRLFDAAGEPKELRWWDAGHVLPPAAIDYTAEWLRERLRPAG